MTVIIINAYTLYIGGEIVDDDDDDPLTTSNGQSDLLKANCFEFDKHQWLQVVQDRSNKEIAMAMADQGLIDRY